MQIIVGEGRYATPAYIADLATRGIIKPEVYEAYQHVIEKGYLSRTGQRSMRDMSIIGSHAQESQKKIAFDAKLRAHQEVLLPEWIKLLDAEVEERTEQKQQQKGNDGEQGQGERSGSKQSQGKGEGTTQAGSSSGAPLTAEEEQELIKELLDELIRNGNDAFGPMTQSDEEKEAMEKAQQRAQKEYQREKAGEQKQGSETATDNAEQPSNQQQDAQDAARKLARDFARERKRSEQRGLAAALGVKERSIEDWNAIKNKHESTITTLAIALAEVFMADRRPVTIYGSREGDIMNGLEAEHVAAIYSGEPDPQTRQHTEQTLEFLQTALWFIADTSGSMSGEKIRLSAELVVVVCEALKQVRETLATADYLTDELEQPLRVAVTTYAASGPNLVTSLDDPITDEKELKMLDQISRVGGGTEGSVALSNAYEALLAREGRELKVMIVLTDGYDNKEGIAQTVNRVVENENVLLLVIALGENQSDADGIASTYLAPAQAARPDAENIFGIAAVDFDTVIPQMTEFLIREVRKKQEHSGGR